MMASASYGIAKKLKSEISVKTPEEEKALYLYEEYTNGGTLSASQLELISAFIPMTEDDEQELMNTLRRRSFREIKVTQRNSASNSTPLITSNPREQIDSEKLANAQIAIALAVLKSPYRAEHQNISRVTDIALRSITCIASGLTILNWAPLVMKQGVAGKAHWLSLSFLAFSLGLNFLVRDHDRVGKSPLKGWAKDNPKNWSAERFSEAYTKARECSHLMPELAGGKHEVWRNQETGLRILFDKDRKAHRAFEVVSVENSKYKEVMLDLKSTFHGLQYSLQKLKGKVRFDFPDGPGREGFLKIFYSVHPQKQFLKWPEIECGTKSFNGGVILRGDILLIDDTLEGSVLHNEYKNLLSTPGFVEMETKDKLDCIGEYAYTRLKFDEQATCKVFENIPTSKLPKNLNLGAHSVVLRLDDFITLGTGECRHRAALMGYMVERLAKEGHLSGEVTYLSNEDHAWIGFTSLKDNRAWELGNSG